MRNNTAVALLAVLAFSFLLRIPGMFEYLAWDEGSYAYAAHSILSGGVPYKDMQIDREPAVILLYTGIFRLAGENGFSVRLIGSLWVCLTGFVIFLFGRRLAGNTAGLIAAFFYGLSMAGTSNCGIRTNTEVFMGLFSVLAYLSAYYAVEKKRPAFLLLAGLAVGLNISFKLSAVMDLAGVTAFVALVSLPDKSVRVRMLKALPYLFLGILAALIPFVLYISYNGALKDAWEQLVLWRFQNLGRDVTDAAGPMSRFKASFKPILLDEAGMYISGGLTLLWALLFRRDKRLTLFVIWALFSFAAVSMTGRFPPYYFPLVVPPLALLAGYGLSVPLATRGRRLRGLSYMLLSIVIAGSLSSFYYINGGYYKNFISAYSAYRKGDITGHDFHADLQADAVDFYEAAKYVRERTRPDDHVYFWVYSGEFYWAANRRPASSILSPFVPGRYHDEEASLKKKVLADVIKNRPAYFVVRDAYMMFIIPPFRSVTELHAFKELDRFLDSNYELEAVTGRAIVYRLAGPGGPKTEAEVFFPEFMKPTLGYIQVQDWFMYSNGEFSSDFNLGEGDDLRKFIVRAYGTESAGAYPHLTVYVDGRRGFAMSVGPRAEDYTFSMRVPAGKHDIRIAYDNDDALPCEKGKDRNLYLVRLTIMYDRSKAKGL